MVLVSWLAAWCQTPVEAMVKMARQAWPPDRRLERNGGVNSVEQGPKDWRSHAAFGGDA